MLALPLGVHVTLAQPAPVQGTTAQGRRHLAGGTDSDESEMMKRLAADYPLTVLLTALDRASLGDARIRVADGGAASVVDTRVVAPFILVDLAPGTYEVSATRAGITQRRRVRIGPRGCERVVSRYDVLVGPAPPLRG